MQFVSALWIVGFAATSVSSFAIPGTARSSFSSTSLSVGGFLGSEKDWKYGGPGGLSKGKKSRFEISDPWGEFDQWVAKSPVENRDGLEGNLLISGDRILVQSSDDKSEAPVADSSIFYMLLEEHYEFKFDKVYVLCENTQELKKQLLSRKARYMGLMDKLEFIEPTGEAEEGDITGRPIPTADQIKDLGITNWILIQGTDQVESLNKAHEVAGEAKGTLKNVVMTMMKYYNDETTTLPILKLWDDFGGARHRNKDLPNDERYEDDDIKYTLLTCGEPTKDVEGYTEWHYEDLHMSGEEKIAQGGDARDVEIAGNYGYTGAKLYPAFDRISSDQVLRFTVDALQLKCMEGGAYQFYDLWLPYLKRPNRFHIRAVKGMRELGYSSTEIMQNLFATKVADILELDVMRAKLRKIGGLNVKPSPAWWDSEEFKNIEMKRNKGKPRDQMKGIGSLTYDEMTEEQRAAAATKRVKLMERIATEFAERKYYEASQNGTLGGMDFMEFFETIEEEAKQLAVSKVIELERESRGLAPEVEEGEEKDILSVNQQELRKRELVMRERALEDMKEMLDDPTFGEDAKADDEDEEDMKDDDGDDEKA